MKNPRKLKKWRAKRSLREAADVIRLFMKSTKSLSHTSLQNYESGETEPLVTTAIAIEKATGGEVSVYDWK